jgi:hypothetical protein
MTVAASAVEPVAAILSRLTALGARIERRGDRLIVRAGPRPVPRSLFEAARLVKPALMQLICEAGEGIGPPKKAARAPKMLTCADGEHLSADPSNSAAGTLGVRLRCSPCSEVSTLAAEARTLGAAAPMGGRRAAQPAREPSPHTPAAGSSLDGEPLTSAWGETEEERAAIVEYDGNIPRAWAEGFARLDRTSPPADLPIIRWRRFVDDVGLFLDSPFCAVAATLGWGPYDLFGCDRDRPFARVDKAGLLWLLDGNRLVMLAADAATIEFSTGARQTWRRKPASPGRVLAWELTG